MIGTRLLSMTNPESSQVQHSPNILIVNEDKDSCERLKNKLFTDFPHRISIAHNDVEALKILNEKEIAVMIIHAPKQQSDTDTFLKESSALQPSTVRLLVDTQHDSLKSTTCINDGIISGILENNLDTHEFHETIRSSVARYLCGSKKSKEPTLAQIEYQDLLRSHDILQEQLELGQQIHELLLKGKAPSIPGVSIQAVSIPSQVIDGDFYDFYQPAKHIFDMVVGDVMGKGIPAALVANAVKTQMTRYALPFARVHVLQDESFWEEDLLHPQQILSNVNEAIGSQLIELEYFASLFYLRMNLKKQTLTYVDCGFTKPIIYREKGSQLSLMEGSDFPLGCVENPVFTEYEIPIQENDIFIFYSDGITEVSSPDGELYGRDRMGEVILKNNHLKAEEIAEKLQEDALQFGQQKQFDDDLTLIVIKVTDFWQSHSQDVHTAKFNSDHTQLPAVREFVKKCV